MGGRNFVGSIYENEMYPDTYPRTCPDFNIYTWPIHFSYHFLNFGTHRLMSEDFEHSYRTGAKAFKELLMAAVQT